LLGVGLVGEQAIEIAFSEHRPLLARRGEGKLRAGPLERLDFRRGLARDRQRRQLLRQQAEGAGVASGSARGGGNGDLDRLALRQPAVRRESARGQRSRSRGPARPQEVSFGAQQRMSLFRELRRAIGAGEPGRRVRRRLAARGHAGRMGAGESEQEDEEDPHPRSLASNRRSGKQIAL